MFVNRLIKSVLMYVAGRTVTVQSECTIFSFWFFCAVVWRFSFTPKLVVRVVVVHSATTPQIDDCEDGSVFILQGREV